VSFGSRPDLFQERPDGSLHRTGARSPETSRPVSSRSMKRARVISVANRRRGAEDGRRPPAGDAPPPQAAGLTRWMSSTPMPCSCITGLTSWPNGVRT